MTASSCGGSSVTWSTTSSRRTPGAPERAASIRAEASLKLPDALILATGALWEVDTVVTSDDRWSTVRIGLEIEALAAS